jgi:hypothetical protein
MKFGGDVRIWKRWNLMKLVSQLGKSFPAGNANFSSLGLKHSIPLSIDL